MNDDNHRVCAEVKLLLSPWLLTSKPETGWEHTFFFSFVLLFFSFFSFFPESGPPY